MADAPIEPGARTLCEPWLTGPRENPWRLIVPAKPLPFERPLAHEAEAELDGLVAVDVLGADRGHRARAGLEHRHALDAAVGEEPLGHSDLLGEDCGHRRYPKASRISMSTPAGRWSSRWSESTVFGVGWWMSIRRLWVRISKCSCESLSLNGDLITA